MLRVRALVALALSLAASSPLPALAGDTWTTPFAGVRRLVRTTPVPWRIHALEVDLCAPGVSVRATRPGEKGRTTSSFGKLVGAEAAVNGDFFLSGYATVGLAVGAGERWPGTEDKNTHGYVAFGDGRAHVSFPSFVEPYAPWMKEAVGGIPEVVIGGKAVTAHTGAFCTDRHPRTAVGLSADKRKLFLAVVDGRTQASKGMTCTEIGTLMRELGAHDALNLDGGGSTAMYVAGAGVVNSPSDGSERAVSNHLGIYAKGSGAAPHCPAYPPRGYLDAAGCDRIHGWAQDPDEPDKAIGVHLYVGGPAGSGAPGISVLADGHRDDLCSAIGSCKHAFSVDTPYGLMDGTAREVFAYGIDSAGGENALLKAAPKVLTCDPPEPPFPPEGAVRRHVPNMEIFAAWKFTALGTAPMDDAKLEAYPEGPPVPEAPSLVTPEGGGPVYLREHAIKRHVPSPAAMKAWGFSFGAVEKTSDDALAALLTGAPLTPRPFLAKGSGPAVYLLDARPPIWGELVAADLPDAIAPGASVEVAFTLRNEGSIAWEPGATHLAPMPRDAESPLCDPSWPSCTRASTVDAAVAPGEAGTFRFRLLAGEEAEHELCLGLVVEDAGIAHFSGDPGQGGPADDGLCRKVRVAEGGAPSTPDAPDGAEADDNGALEGGCACGVVEARTNASRALVLVLLTALAALRRRRSG